MKRRFYDFFPSVAVLLLVLGCCWWAWHRHCAAEALTLRLSYELGLDHVLIVMQDAAEDGRFPAADVACAALQAAAPYAPGTGVFTVADLRYNPHRPLLGSDAIILYVQANGWRYILRANNFCEPLTPADTEPPGFVTLVPAAGHATAVPATTSAESRQ